VYVSNTNSSTVSAISGTVVVATVKVGPGPTALAFNPSNGYVYVADTDVRGGGHLLDNVTVLSGSA